MLAAAAVIFGTLAPFVRGISVSSGELALYRAVMAALLVGGYLLVSGQKHALRANRRERTEDNGCGCKHPARPPLFHESFLPAQKNVIIIKASPQNASRGAHKSRH